MAVLILVHTIVWQSEISLKTEWGGAGFACSRAQAGPGSILDTFGKIEVLHV